MYNMAGPEGDRQILKVERLLHELRAERVNVLCTAILFSLYWPDSNKNWQSWLWWLKDCVGRLDERVVEILKAA